jgi:hypothetical protein
LQLSLTSVAEPHQDDADPDPACHFDAYPDPNPACHFDADPDPACHFDEDPDPACDFHADVDLESTFHFDAVRDLDPSFHRKAQNLRKSAQIGSFSIHFGLSSVNLRGSGSSL